ncbi:hypothetical protein DFP94_101959 [Fontibacillus phaseoli]|uniref:Uncharacterized protein n=1 Tax=Fontibacillus phaseoli TaxID=1416533 RepID=A0A369BP19_9BACL|nr:hypothetical protein [Fontibacillus phaseoli]RCX23360.1 hypothetical protein DFP94_101959 [Fontibacillus phaseoli]
MADMWESCPRCKSDQVVTRGKLYYFLLWFAAGGILMWTGLLVYWPAMIAGFLFIIVSIFSFMMPRVNRCTSCRHKWKP